VNEDDEMEADEEMVEDAPKTNGTSPHDGPKKLNDYLQALVPTLLPLIRPTLLSFAPPFQQSLHPPTTSALGALHIAVLECLNNVSLTLAEALDGMSPEATGIANGVGHGSAVGLAMQTWGEVWTMLTTIGRPEGIGAGPERKKEAWLVALGVLWAVGRICRGQLVRPGGRPATTRQMSYLSSELQDSGCGTGAAPYGDMRHDTKRCEQGEMHRHPRVCSCTPVLFRSEQGIPPID
jgi:hypothetical protein